MAESKKTVAKGKKPIPKVEPVQTEEVVENIEVFVEEKPTEEITEEVVSITKGTESPVEETVEEVLIAEEIDPIEPKEIAEEVIEEEPKPTVPEESTPVEDRGYYIVKLNKFLSRDLSKYAVRIKTPNGVKELTKASRSKAYKIAYDLNKVHGYDFKEVFVEE